MGITANVSGDNKTVTIKVNGRFDFSLHNEFRKSYKDIDMANGQFIVDLKDTDYLDSSALGMLLLLREHADKCTSKVKITNISNDIREILNIASFDRLFVLS